MNKKLLFCLSLMAAGSICASADDAKAIYDKQCAKCHGADGKGKTKMGLKIGAKDLTDAKVQAALKDEAAFKALKEGVKDGDKVVMKPAENVTDEQIKTLVAFVRKFKK